MKLNYCTLKVLNSHWTILHLCVSPQLGHRWSCCRSTILVPTLFPLAGILPVHSWGLTRWKFAVVSHYSSWCRTVQIWNWVKNIKLNKLLHTFAKIIKNCKWQCTKTPCNNTEHPDIKHLNILYEHTVSTFTLQVNYNWRENRTHTNYIPISVKDFKAIYIQDSKKRLSSSLRACQGLIQSVYQPREDPLVHGFSQSISCVSGLTNKRAGWIINLMICKQKSVFFL